MSQRGVCFAAGCGLWVGAGGFGTDYRGDRGPVVYGPAGIRAAAMWRIKVASGQAAAKARRTRRSHLDNPRAELQEPQANGGELGCGERVCLGDCITQVSSSQ